MELVTELLPVNAGERLRRKLESLLKARQMPGQRPQKNNRTAEKMKNEIKKGIFHQGKSYFSPQSCG